MIRLFKSKESKFWEWFIKNEDFLSNWKKDQTNVFNSLYGQLQKVKKGLTFVFGPVHDGKQEFIISADGFPPLIPFVQNLMKNAPKLENWKIIAFRPVMPKLDSIIINETEIDPKKLRFIFNESNEDRINLTFFIEGDKNRHQEYQNATFIFLDHLIGEYNVMTKIGGIQWSLGDKKSGYPISDFLKYWNQKNS